jgi:hypothetical protein
MLHLIGWCTSEEPGVCQKGVTIMRTAVLTERNKEHSQRVYARFAGLMYLLVLGFDIVGQLIVSAISGGRQFR